MRGSKAKKLRRLVAQHAKAVVQQVPTPPPRLGLWGRLLLRLRALLWRKGATAPPVPLRPVSGLTAAQQRQALRRLKHKLKGVPLYRQRKQGA